MNEMEKQLIIDNYDGGSILTDKVSSKRAEQIKRWANAKYGVNSENLNQDILSLIERRRRQILVHSYIYYELDNNLIDDHKWADWAKELVTLQEEYPEESKIARYYKEFIGFDPSTGQGLPYRNPEIIAKAEYLLELMGEE